MVGGGNPDGALLGGILSQAIPEIFRRIGISSDIANVFFAFQSADGAEDWAECQRRMAHKSARRRPSAWRCGERT